MTHRINDFLSSSTVHADQAALFTNNSLTFLHISHPWAKQAQNESHFESAIQRGI